MPADADFRSPGQTPFGKVALIRDRCGAVCMERTNRTQVRDHSREPFVGELQRAETRRHRPDLCGHRKIIVPASGIRATPVRSRRTKCTNPVCAEIRADKITETVDDQDPGQPRCRQNQHSAACVTRYLSASLLCEANENFLVSRGACHAHRGLGGKEPCDPGMRADLARQLRIDIRANDVARRFRPIAVQLAGAVVANTPVAA